ncbi:uncharacterized protein FOMMEDRAFT_153330 [Fomitiporia mediterranea MF3/22]|uniref:uncharacterized protein n=1 Tax=Fomitiporia mediterranea (strain MF3/22) TaxID=694068 RepID=UPI0004409C00|nr:uncharacterized protein FOMMEDRAFT_153330 [Fomitiporia mediterranea MF3/22]EJD05982.1 hypothetical protein FOMMEDRAFT_153330 [Fomitiporia mediterranea MF3/22]
MHSAYGSIASGAHGPPRTNDKNIPLSFIHCIRLAISRSVACMIISRQKDVPSTSITASVIHNQRQTGCTSPGSQVLDRQILLVLYHILTGAGNPDNSAFRSPWRLEAHVAFAAILGVTVHHGDRQNMNMNMNAERAATFSVPDWYDPPADTPDLCPTESIPLLDATACAQGTNSGSNHTQPATTLIISQRR